MASEGRSSAAEGSGSGTAREHAAGVGCVRLGTGAVLVEVIHSKSCSNFETSLFIRTSDFDLFRAQSRAEGHI
jgi:hypothetical protein